MIDQAAVMAESQEITINLISLSVAGLRLLLGKTVPKRNALSKITQLAKLKQE
jgi:hypothetical protein